MKSAQRTLVTGMSALMLVLFFAMFLLGDYAVKRMMHFFIERELNTQLAVIKQFLTQPGWDNIMVALDARYGQPSSGYYFQWQQQSGEGKQQILSPSLMGHALRLPVVVPGHAVVLAVAEPKGRDMMVLAQSFYHEQAIWTIAVGESQTKVKDKMRFWRLSLFILLLLVFILFFSFVSWYVARVFDSFRRLQKNVALLEEGAITRLDPYGIEETHALILLMNRFLELEERHGQRVRQTLSHLAHALKLPVTSLAHVAERKELVALPEVKQLIAEQTDMMRRIVERQLKRASLTGRSLVGERFSLGREIPALVRALEHLYYDKNLEIECRMPKDQPYPGNRDDLLELTGNLLDNACKWAASRVVLSAGYEGGLWLTIEDDGPGLTADQLRLLQESKGVRFDQSRSGEGLGLLIVRDVVEFYGGRVVFGKSEELGGVMVQVVLP